MSDEKDLKSLLSFCTETINRPLKKTHFDLGLTCI